MDASSFCASFPVYLMPPAWGAHPILEQRWCVWSGHQMRGRANRLGLPNCSIWKQSQRLGLREGGMASKAARGFVPRVCSPSEEAETKPPHGKVYFFSPIEVFANKNWFGKFIVLGTCKTKISTLPLTLETFFWPQLMLCWQPKSGRKPLNGLCQGC